MNYPEGQYMIYQQSNNIPDDEYGEEYAYEEYVHGDGRPSGYKREVRYVKNSENPKQIYSYEEQKIERPKTNNIKITKQTTTTISKTKNQKKPNDYNIYEVQEFQKPKQNGKTVRRAYACSPQISLPNRYMENSRSNSGNKTQYQSNFSSSYNSNRNQNNQPKKKSNLKNKLKSNSPQERKHNVYISGGNINNNTKNQNQYKYQKNYQSSNNNRINKNSNLRQVNNYNNQNDQQRKTEVIIADKRYKKTFNDGFNPNQKQNSFAANNHNVYEVKEVTKEKMTVAQDPNNTNIHHHRYNYGSYNPNISNTVSHSINETSKEPKQQVVINQRKTEVIIADKHYKKTYNDSMDNNNVKNLNSNNSFCGRQYKYNFNQTQHQRQNSSNNYGRMLRNNNSTSSFNRNKNNSISNKHNVYNSNNTNTNKNNNYPKRQYNNKIPHSNNNNLRGYNKTYNKTQDNFIIKDDNMQNQKVHSIIYSKKDQNKNNSYNSKGYTQNTKTNKTGNNNRGYIVSETQKFTRTTGNNGRTREFIETKKERKFENKPNFRDEVVNYENEEEYGEGFVYGQEDEGMEEN